MLELHLQRTEDTLTIRLGEHTASIPFIQRNTLAVLGPAANRRSDWRNNLVDIRNQATAHGSRHLVMLLDAVIGLLEAGGNPAGLGEGLTGIYARIWQKIVEQLPGV